MIALEKPSGFNDLIAEAANLYRELVQSEQRTVVKYWEFGRRLERLRSQYVGNWMEFLKSQGWSYSRVKRAVRISDRYSRVEDCQDLTLLQALDYKDTPKNPPPTEKVRKCVLPPKTMVKEALPQPDEPREPSPPSDCDSPAATILSVYRDDKTNDEKEEITTFDPTALDRLVHAELSRFTKDEIRTARNYLMSFDDPPRAYDVLGYVLIAAVVKGKIRTSPMKVPCVTIGMTVRQP
jgi:hypothetical protein